MLTILLFSTAAPRAAPLDVSRARLARRDVLGCGSAGRQLPAANAVPPPKTNVTEALEKNKVVVRRKDLLTEVVVDPKTGDELREIQLPAGYPKSLRPPRLVERRVSEAELALAAVVAGRHDGDRARRRAAPLATLKSRAQARPGTGPLALIDADGNGIIEPREVKDLYAGLVPSVSAAARARSASCFWGRVDGVPPIPCPAQPRPRRATPRAKSRGGSSRPWRRRRSRWPCSRRRPRRRRRSWSARRPTCSRRAPRSGGAARRSPPRRPRRRPSASGAGRRSSRPSCRTACCGSWVSRRSTRPRPREAASSTRRRGPSRSRSIAALLTTPLDVARTRVLLDRARRRGRGPARARGDAGGGRGRGLALLGRRAARRVHGSRRRGVHPAPDALLRRAPGLDHPRRGVPVRRDHVRFLSG